MGRKDHAGRCQDSLPVKRRQEVAVRRVHADDLLCTGLRDDLVCLKKQLLKKYELETLLMGDDDDVAKKAVYLGGTLE